ncbi:hypothetical protein CR969_02250 [Candidatus Saccharibacteria bacterium]|nr:MAG: hypothetical protein CR969_02250 [Candidatus Saccharibacteria bacterium]
MTQKHRQGFTLIELMIAMAFVSVLLLAIAFTAIQAGRMYNRGMILRSVNQSGRDVSDMLRRDFLQSNRDQIVDVGGNIVITVNDGPAQSGRFCLGRYSYLWNSADTIDNPAAVSSNPAVVYDDNGQPINFVRVIDENGSLCRQVDGKYPNILSDPTRVTQILKTQSDQSDVVIAVHGVAIGLITDPADPEGLYSIRLTLGTSKQSEINTADQTCKPPSDSLANLDFCAINKFEMIVRTNG